MSESSPSSLSVLPPRVLLVMPDQWPRAHTRAALREVGYDAVGTRSLPNALRIASTAAERGPVRLVVVDQRALHGDAATELRALREHFTDPRLVLIASAASTRPAGEWERILTRPLSVADIVSAVQAMLPLPVELRRPVD